jgi:GNAT superfamily N-acetyltransferase
MAPRVNRSDRPEGLSFWPALPSDARGVVGLVESAYRGDESRKGWTTEADLLSGQRTDLAQVTELIATGPGVIWLATREAELLACIHLVPVYKQEAQAVLASGEVGCLVKLGMFAVRPELQGQGIGSALLAHCEQLAQTQYLAAGVELHVIALRSELIGYYLRRGYVMTRESEAFPYGDARFGIPLRDDLVFAVMRKSLV